MARKVRFTVSLDKQADDRLVRLGARQHPPLRKQYLVEMAILRFLDAAELGQAELPLATER